MSQKKIKNLIDEKDKPLEIVTSGFEFAPKFQMKSPDQETFESLKDE